jgi:hypothetical protein
MQAWQSDLRRRRRGSSDNCHLAITQAAPHPISPSPGNRSPHARIRSDFRKKTFPPASCLNAKFIASIPHPLTITSLPKYHESPLDHHRAARDNGDGLRPNALISDVRTLMIGRPVHYSSYIPHPTNRPAPDSQPWFQCPIRETMPIAGSPHGLVVLNGGTVNCFSRCRQLMIRPVAAGGNFGRQLKAPTWVSRRRTNCFLFSLGACHPPLPHREL